MTYHELCEKTIPPSQLRSVVYTKYKRTHMFAFLHRKGSSALIMSDGDRNAKVAMGKANIPR